MTDSAGLAEPGAPAAGSPAVYDLAKRVARGGEEDARARLACLPGTAPEILYYLANDSAVTVRAAVAANPTTPPQADGVLASDADARVRALLGRKLAALAPVLSEGTRDRLQQLAWQTLRRLAADAAELVRAAIAEELKAMPDAPRELILRLANDAAMTVAEPIIRLSPLLTEADLLALIAAPAVPETVTAVARRANIGEAVCDAIIRTADAAAVAALLENRSAAISEATLDAVIAGAVHEASWQPALIRRPSLTAGQSRALAGFVADHLLGALAGRDDLDPRLAALLTAQVAARLAGQPAKAPAAASGVVAWGTKDPNAAFEAAARTGDRSAMRRALASADVSGAALDRALHLRSARALIALCWKAGLAPRASLLAQSALGGLGPSEVLALAPDGGWPLSCEELAWQIELLRYDA